MTQESRNAFRIRLAAVALALSGALFVLFPVVRPFSDECGTELTDTYETRANEWYVPKFGPHIRTE